MALASSEPPLKPIERPKANEHLDFQVRSICNYILRVSIVSNALYNLYNLYSWLVWAHLDTFGLKERAPSDLQALAGLRHV